MTNKTTQKKQSFWQGFFLGSIVGTTILYFLGTKNGREKLREILDLLEKEDLIDELEKLLSSEKNTQSSGSLSGILQTIGNKISQK